LVFPFILYYWKFFEDREVQALQGAVTKWKNPLQWMALLKNEVTNLTNKISSD
jgi:hypothetical protein